MNTKGGVKNTKIFRQNDTVVRGTRRKKLSRKNEIKKGLVQKAVKSGGANDQLARFKGRVHGEGLPMERNSSRGSYQNHPGGRGQLDRPQTIQKDSRRYENNGNGKEAMRSRDQG